MSLEVGGGRRRLRALSHPLRLRILALVAGPAMSSAELARELDMNHAAVSFHVRQLVAAGYLELAETRSVRGGQERRYRQRVMHRRRSGCRRIPADGQRHRRGADPAGRRRVGTWKVFADAELWVDRAVWDDARRRIAAAMKDLDDAAAAPHTDGTVHVSATALLLEVGDGDRAR